MKRAVALLWREGRHIALTRSCRLAGRILRRARSRIDRHGDRQARTQKGLRLARHADADGHALDDLGEIAGGVFRRQEAEGRARGRRQAFDVPFKVLTEILALELIHLDMHTLAGTQVAQLGFLEVRRHIDAG